MKRGSLRFRLLVAAAASILMALALASLGLIALFERHVERRFAAELESELRQLIGSLTWSAGTVTVQTPLADTRFQEPLSGLYWQVSENGVAIARSRSLWDADLKLPDDALRDAEVHQHTIEGPAGARLLIVERAVMLPNADRGSFLRVVVGVDRRELNAARNAFGRDLVPYVTLLAIFLLVATWGQVTIGLRPLQTVRARLSDVRAGRSTMLGPDFPDEVRPLASEVDQLLKAQEAAIMRARSRAADLAHGLRTPLTALQADAEELKYRGESELGAEIAELTQAMRRHVDRELARSRAGFRTGAVPEPLLPVVDSIVRVVSRLPQAQSLSFAVAIPANLRVPMDAQDLSELLGNLIENSSKWARSQIRIHAEAGSTDFSIFVEDDGPGIADEQSAEALSRGGRLDLQRSGTGLGLAIVQDLLEAYGGTLQLSRSPLGGLKAEVRLNAPSDARS